MQKRNIRAPTAITVIASFLLIISVFGMTFRLFKLPDSSGGGSGGTSGGGNTVVVPPSDETPGEIPDDTTDAVGPFDGKIPDNVLKIEGDLKFNPPGGLRATETDTGYVFNQTNGAYGLAFIDSTNNSVFSDIAYLTVDFDLTVTAFKNTILFAPAFCYNNQLSLESLGQLKFTSDKKVYHCYNGDTNEYLTAYDGDSLHITFVYCKGVNSSFISSSSTCSSIYCYIDGNYIGQIAGYQVSRESKVYFNGLLARSITSGSYGTEFSVDNVEIYAYSNSYEPKDFDTILSTQGPIYNCVDWCYYKEIEQAS